MYFEIILFEVIFNVTNLNLMGEKILMDDFDITKPVTNNKVRDLLEKRARIADAASQENERLYERAPR